MDKIRVIHLEHGFFVPGNLEANKLHHIPMGNMFIICTASDKKIKIKGEVYTRVFMVK